MAAGRIKTREDKAEEAFCFVFSYRRDRKNQEKAEKSSYGLGSRKKSTDKKILAGSICRISGGGIYPCRNLVCLADWRKDVQRQLCVREYFRAGCGG